MRGPRSRPQVNPLFLQRINVGPPSSCKGRIMSLTCILYNWEGATRALSTWRGAPSSSNFIRRERVYTRHVGVKATKKKEKKKGRIGLHAPVKAPGHRAGVAGSAASARVKAATAAATADAV